MRRINILVYTPDAELLERMLNIIYDQEGWQAMGTTSDERAIELFMQHKYDLVILGGAIDSVTDTKLKRLFTRQDRHISILNFHGGDDWYLRVQVQTILKLDEDRPMVTDGLF